MDHHRLPSPTPTRPAVTGPEPVVPTMKSPSSLMLAAITFSALRRRCSRCHEKTPRIDHLPNLPEYGALDILAYFTGRLIFVNSDNSKTKGKASTNKEDENCGVRKHPPQSVASLWVVASGRICLLDLSSNELNGTIPREITKITRLVSLNLSNNQLVGSIPSNIGELGELEVLDLSRNQLSCTIPTSIADLSFLSILNLSFNTLFGKIPDGAELQSFDASSYLCNPHLCGPPLNRTCSGNELFEALQHCSDSEVDTEYEHEHDGNHEDNSGWWDMFPFYMSMGVGFFTGFWVFWGSLLLIKSWRYAYFSFLGNMNDMIYVTVAVALAKLQRKIQGQHVP